MKNRFFFAVFLWVTGLVLTGCKTKVVEIRPPEIAYGEDICALCNMAIDEPRFAASILLVNGEYLKFDDIGDMVAYQSDHDIEALAFYVHDFYTEEWLRAEDAFYIQSDNVHSPMGHGLAAFADEADADKFSAEIMTPVMVFKDLKNIVATMPMEQK